MNNRLINGILLLCIILSLTSCSQVVKDNNQNETPKTHNNSTVQSNKVGASKKASSTPTASTGLDHIFNYLKYDYKNNYLQILDYTNGSVKKKIDFKKNSFAQFLYDFKNGYAAYVCYADQPVKLVGNSDFESIVFPDKINSRTLNIYDKNLVLKKTLKIDKIMSKEAIEAMANIAISEDGQKIAWSYFQNLYAYDVNSGKTSKLLDEKNNTVFLVNAQFTKDNKSIVYYGSSPDDKEGDVRFGLVDLNNMKSVDKTIKNYSAFDIRVSGKYACLNDTVDPKSGLSSGIVPVINSETKEILTMKVNKDESALATVTEDGKYLLVVGKLPQGTYRIRKYDMKTNKVLGENGIETDFADGKADGILWSGKPGVYYIKASVGKDKYSFYAYNCEEK